MDGIINIFKEKGYTSHDVVAILRKILRQKRIGHTGTLDPEAEGVLPICIGKATKLSSLITDGTKEYIAGVRFGKNTDTLDHTGNVTDQFNFEFDEKKVLDVVNSFKGESMQIPPMYSAIKIKGKKLYQLAREGKVVKRDPRKITIYEINVIEVKKPDYIKIKVKCSKGTYIRSLCQDIGTELGYGAYMDGLIRTQSGSFNLDNSYKIETIKQKQQLGELEDVLLKMEDALEKYPKYVVDSIYDRYLRNGNVIHIDQLSIDLFKEHSIIRIYTSENKFIGLYQIICEDNGYKLKPSKILA